jgi:uncharacterized protein YceH (UPF0502 family)
MHVHIRAGHIGIHADRLAAKVLQVVNFSRFSCDRPENVPAALSSIVMHFSELTPPEQRVLGCLIEKRWTTPDQYPLSLNALRLACNQSTNRDPVTDYDEGTVRDAAQRLSRYGLTRLASGHTTRATKYRHLAEEALGLDRPALAALAVLLLRGPQTPGEIKSRSERMAPGATLSDTEEVLATLIDRGYARRLPRRPGQKEERFEHLFGGATADDGDATGSALAAAAFAPATVSSGAEPSLGEESVPRFVSRDGMARRIDALEEEVARLRGQLKWLAEELGMGLDEEPDAEANESDASDTDVSDTEPSGTEQSDTEPEAPALAPPTA